MSSEVCVEKMDAAIPTTSQAARPKKKGKKPKRLNGRRKSKNVRIKVKVEDEDEKPVYVVEKILRKAEFVSSGGETKYLVRWPSTWERKDSLDNCPELLEQFEAGLPQNIDSDDTDDDDDNTEPFPSEWAVQQILEKRYDEDGEIQYLLKWKDTWRNASCLQAEVVQDYEDKLKLQRLLAMDAKHANNNNNNDMDVDGVTKEKAETMKRRRSTCTDELADEMEPSAKKPENNVQNKKVDEPIPNSPKVIEMELIEMSDQRKIERIIDIGKSNDGSFSFILKFETGELGIITRKLGNLKYPQEVIAFYQRRIKFS